MPRMTRRSVRRCARATSSSTRPARSRYERRASRARRSSVAAMSSISRNPSRGAKRCWRSPIARRRRASISTPPAARSPPWPVPACARARAERRRASTCSSRRRARRPRAPPQSVGSSDRWAVRSAPCARVASWSCPGTVTSARSPARVALADWWRARALFSCRARGRACVVWSSGSTRTPRSAAARSRSPRASRRSPHSRGRSRSASAPGRSAVTTACSPPSSATGRERQRSRSPRRVGATSRPTAHRALG